MAVRVLVVDDSVLYRRVLTDALKSLPDVEVVGSAASGSSVLPKFRELKPDLITLDIEMPGMSGIEVMEALRREALEVKVLVVSALTVSGGELTLKALERGAFDFITKPSEGSAQENFRCICDELAPRLRAIARRLEVQTILRRGTPPAASVAKTAAVSTPAPLLRRAPIAASAAASNNHQPELVVIGVSTGGPNALQTIFSALPGDLAAPIVIVQHMPPIFTKLLAGNLAAHSKLPVREAAHNEALSPGTAYIAPGGKQMRVVPALNGRRLLQLSDDPPENCCRPAVDYLFRSVANHFPGKALAVILTGMGEDGTAGLRLLKRGGSMVIAQDEASCVVFGMPKAAIEAGVVDLVLPLEAIADRITALVRGSQS